jgi:hypothetical protein
MPHDKSLPSIGRLFVYSYATATRSDAWYVARSVHFPLTAAGCGVLAAIELEL